jgi:polyhydroxyalkanoate synthesis repressor PhaR
MPEPVVLKKYANRRLYDTSRSAYVTLDEVAELIKAGREVRAVDAKTKEDVTAFILTQIVLENARKKNILLPVPLLHVIIRFGDNLLSDFFHNYMEVVIKNYLAYKTKVDAQFKRWLDLGLDFSELSKQSLSGLSPFPFFGTPAGGKEEDPQEK